MRVHALVAAAAHRERRGAGQRIDLAVDPPRLLDDADPERQAEIGRRLEFDAGIRAADGQRAGLGVERRECVAADARIVFQRVETGKEGDGRPAAVLQAVAELHAFAIERPETAEGALAETAEAHGVALAADKKAVRKIVARIGRTVSDVAEVKARKVPVRVRALVRRRISPESHRPARNPITHRPGLGVGRLPAQTEHRRGKYET